MSQIACDIAEALELNSSFNYVDARTINNKLYINNYIHSFSTCNKHVFCIFSILLSLLYRLIINFVWCIHIFIYLFEIFNYSSALLCK